MLSYQHGYHAGNFADVVKHLTLSLLISYLTQKEKPLFYLETHSGRGVYDLKNAQALKTGEFKEGIELLWHQQMPLPETFNTYLQCIKDLNSEGSLRYYPGSPAIAIDLLRPIDRLFCCELHPQEFDVLKTIATKRRKVHYSNSDGIAQLKAMLPPVEKRGLIFIDPSFEIKDEYKTIPKAINEAYQRFSTGVYCLWYPIVNSEHTFQLTKYLKQIPSTNTLNIEFHNSHSNTKGMGACGLWIINPPFCLEEQLNTSLTFLKKIFNMGQSSFIIKK